MPLPCQRCDTTTCHLLHSMQAALTATGAQPLQDDGGGEGWPGQHNSPDTLPAPQSRPSHTTACFAFISSSTTPSSSSSSTTSRSEAAVHPVDPCTNQWRITATPLHSIVWAHLGASNAPTGQSAPGICTPALHTHPTLHPLHPSCCWRQW